MNPVSALVDAATGAVLAFGKHGAAMLELGVSNPNVIVEASLDYPSYQGFLRSVPLRLMMITDPFRWKWNFEKRLLSKTPEMLITDKLRSASQLAQAQYDALSKMIYTLSLARQRVIGGVSYQAATYLEKKLEAERFRASGYDEASILEYPYVLQYADYAQIPFQQAADSILFKAKLYDQQLAKIDTLRMKYFGKVKKAAHPDELPTIYREFMLESYISAKV